MFGLSRSFWSLALWYVFGERLRYSFVDVTCVSQPRRSRFFSGALNGNVGVVKSVLAELADDSNVAQAFSFLPLVFVIGQVIGFVLLIYSPLLSFIVLVRLRSFVGGFLARPQDRWPEYFPQPFWAEYPYFLPCLAVASFSLIQFVIAALFFKEVGSQIL